MSKPALNPSPAQAEETIQMPLPPKGRTYIAVPDDIRLTAINSEAIHSLCRIAGGDLVAELNEKLSQLVTACGSLNRKGGLSLKVNIAPGGMGKMEISFDCDIKPPKEKRHPSMLFCTPKGQLLANDPSQQELDLRVVPDGQRPPLRVVEDPKLR